MQCDNVVVLDRKLIPARFSSWCNDLTHMRFHSSCHFVGGTLTPTRFSSWCNVFDDNVVVLDGKLSYES